CGRCVPCQTRGSRSVTSGNSASTTSSGRRGTLKGSSVSAANAGNENEMCIMRKCEMLTDDSDVFKAIGDLSLPTVGEDGNSNARPRKQRQSKAACTDFLKRLSGSMRPGPGATGTSTGLTIATISTVAKETSQEEKDQHETPGSVSKRVVPSILQRKKRPTASGPTVGVTSIASGSASGANNTSPIATIVSSSGAAATSQVSGTPIRGPATSHGSLAGVQGTKFVTSGPVAGISPSAFSAVVESGQ
ncbi:hypothetical protein BIW11_06419, partial [Tropilaelaps mercedesae]